MGLRDRATAPTGEPALVWITCRQHAAETQALVHGREGKFKEGVSGVDFSIPSFWPSCQKCRFRLRAVLGERTISYSTNMLQ